MSYLSPYQNWISHQPHVQQTFNPILFHSCISITNIHFLYFFGSLYFPIVSYFIQDNENVNFENAKENL